MFGVGEHGFLSSSHMIRGVEVDGGWWPRAVGVLYRRRDLARVEAPPRCRHRVLHCWKASRVQDRIDLRPLLAHRAAAEMLLLARGQLNQAFRTHGLMSPDPLCTGDPSHTDIAELDAPATRGIEHARARFGAAFDIWAGEMPLKLVRPVLDILRQALQALKRQNGASEASAAVLKAHEFLLSQLPHG